MGSSQGDIMGVGKARKGADPLKENLVRAKAPQSSRPQLWEWVIAKLYQLAWFKDKLTQQHNLQHQVVNFRIMMGLILGIILIISYQWIGTEGDQLIRKRHLLYMQKPRHNIQEEGISYLKIEFSHQVQKLKIHRWILQRTTQENKAWESQTFWVYPQFNIKKVG